jgi:TetR/AcrR family transcriptional repressor of nem operon
MPSPVSPSTPPAPARRSVPAERILDVAERLVQTRGFNGFSYADISAELRVTKASLHYHFRTKAELGKSLIGRYHDTFQRALDAIDAETADAPRRLERYVRLYAEVLRSNRICLCGMLASDYATLPRAMKELVNRFFDANELWLTRTLEEGRKARTLRLSRAPDETARALVASLEGAMLVARAYGDASRFDSAAGHLIAQLTGK